MKYLSDYIQEKQTKLFNDLWIIFAFSDKQFNEQKKEWIVYTSLWSWIICPKENAKEFIKRHWNIVEEWIQEDIKENWIEKIIERELANHECYYTWDVSDAVDRLVDYWIWYDEVLRIYRLTYDKHSENF